MLPNSKSCSKIAVVFCFLLVLHLVTSIHAARRSRNRTNYNGNSIVRNLPQRQALEVYLKHLELIIKFGMKHKNLIDLNLYFGLFLVSVNLENIVKYKQRNIPVGARMRITELLKNNKKLLDYFKQKVAKDKNKKNKNDKMIFSLFSNLNLWIDRLQTYPASISKHMFYQSPDLLQKNFKSWDKYMKKIDNVNEWNPNPGLSDYCLIQVARYVPKQITPTTIPKCQFLNTECHEMLVNGSDFGYALSHRLLLLILARLGRGCSIFEPAVDRELAKRFCAAAFSEAEYIAMHGFQAVDLMLEQMTLCSLDGHSEFLAYSWIQMLLRFQTPHGCFYQKRYSEKKVYTLWKMSKNHDLLQGHCNSHVTGVAAATLSAVCRNIIVTYY